MSDIKMRLDKVRALIQKTELLEGKGTSNEENIRIFCYEPENEMVVRHFVNQLETDQSLACHLIVCNLYKTFLSIQQSRIGNLQKKFNTNRMQKEMY